MGLPDPNGTTLNKALNRLATLEERLEALEQQQ